MKKFIVMFLTAFSMISITACGGPGEKVAGGKVENIVTNKEEKSVEIADNVSDKGPAGYGFKVSGTEIYMDESADALIGKLGEADEYYEAASCAFDGMDKVYVYDGFEVDTYPSEDGDKISAVVLLSDSVSTPEGIFIGSSIDNVTEIYGDDYETEDDSMIFTSEGMRLCFVHKDGVVTGIEYLSKVHE